MKYEGIIKGKNISLRIVTLEDCNEIYLSWLKDKEINKYLETRWQEQSIDSIKAFVLNILNSSDSYLFAIILNITGKHIGNIKIGPINKNHSYADVSYFIGEKTAWGKGYATEAIGLVTDFGFDKLALHRLQAGLYEKNVSSERCLEKSGYKLEGIMRKQLKSDNGWEDHKYFSILKEEWKNTNNEDESTD